jgi:hypothetical protein
MPISLQVEAVLLTMCGYPRTSYQSLPFIENSCMGVVSYLRTCFRASNFDVISSLFC